MYAEGNSKISAILPSVRPDDPNARKLLSVAYKEGRYWIYHARDFSSNESLKLPADQPWISLKHLNHASFKGRFNPKYGYKIK